MDPGVAEDTLLMHIRRGVEKTTFAEMTEAGLNLALARLMRRVGDVLLCDRAQFLGAEVRNGGWMG